ncbi:MAG TPA: D-alanine--D-alanine ligase [Candidatus Faecousia excrementigallinarum]|uniref:D-alanine--D-alanine ligase n=1 Tax=Candidatus Faecousia excrementigallinarum TaxID=2840806 RepID=A0A9D0Z2N5_9FIRM|nr:D-alanine--D-alanine ligase [Candidatus Faecousia excrementigallinarum]
MRKINVLVLFGGMSPEHEVSLRSAESVLNHMSAEKYNILPVGITKEGAWILYGGHDYSQLPSGLWTEHPANRPATISPIRGQGLLCFEGDCVVRQSVDVVFPVLHGENGEDGAMQGLLQLAGIPYVGPHVSASAVAMDKTLTKLVADNAGITQAKWQLVRNSDLNNRIEQIVDQLETRFSYPMFVKPAGTGSSVGVSKAGDRATLMDALLSAGVYDDKILVEEFIHGKEIEVAVMGNDSPVASICGEIDSGTEFYDYEAKYITDTSVAYIPARIPEDVAEQVRDQAVRIYSAIGCQGLSRVDFFVTYEDNRVVFNEINTIPGFTSISMYPKLFAASGIPYEQLIDELLQLAMEACK